MSVTGSGQAVKGKTHKQQKLHGTGSQSYEWIPGETPEVQSPSIVRRLLGSKVHEINIFRELAAKHLGPH